jgi:hypothetical protein
LCTRATAALLALLWSIGCAGPDEGATARTSASDRPAPQSRFVTLDPDTVRDTSTGLEWTSRDSGRDLGWHDADRHCRTLALGGRTGWRLPEIHELEGLSDTRVPQSCGDRACHLDPTIRLSGPYVWSATGSDPARRFYRDFQFGTSLQPHIGRLRRLVLCVR